jgi:hypothetical protein
VRDTLWVADVDALRGFDRRTGRPVAVVDLAGLGVTSLGGVAQGPDGAVYVAAAGGRVYRVGPNRRASVALSDTRLASPGAIAWDARRARFVLAPSRSDTLFTWSPGDATARPLAVGPGGYVGLVATPDGRVFVASGGTERVYEQRDRQLVGVLAGLTGLTGLGYDAVHRRIAVALGGRGRVVFYGAP